MSDQTKNAPGEGAREAPTADNGTTVKPEPATQNGATGAGDEATGAAAAAGIDPAEIVATLESQIKDLTDRLLRAHADMDNLRKRGEREREETAKYAITKFARDVVSVSDNFERAVSAVPATAIDADPALKGLVEGVRMTEREFLNVLERHGVKRIDAAGEPFNPHMHQAVMEQPSADAAPGTVLQVFQAGYRIEDRCLRPAMVVVAKAAPKPAAVAPEAAAGEAGPANDPGGAKG